MGSCVICNSFIPSFIYSFILISRQMLNHELLIDYLQASLNPPHRENAERQLKLMNELPGFSPILLKIVVSDACKMPIRQAAAIYFKNYVKKDWHIPHDKTHNCDIEDVDILEEDKEVIRENIIEALAHSPEILRIQLATCLNTIIKCDFPNKWPSLIPKIHVFISEKNMDMFMGGLICFHQLIKNYEYKRAKERAPLYLALDQLLPTIGDRFNILFQNNDEQSLTIQKQIYKLFYSAIQFQLPPQLMNYTTFSGWIQIFLTALNSPIPAHINELDDDDKASSVWWKSKKWILHSICRIFERYGLPLNASSEYKEFAQYYMTTYSTTIIETILKYLDCYRQNTYISPRVLQFCFSYLSDCISPSYCWKLLKPHVHVIYTEIVFKLLKYNDDDAFQWENDPIEYIRTKFDFYEDFISPVTAAKNFLFTVCHRRQGILDEALAFCVSVLQQNNHTTTTSTTVPQVAESMYRNVDGVLNMIGTVADVLSVRPSFKDQIEPFIINYIYPNFMHPAGYLRARACWIIYQFKTIKFTPENSTKLVQTILTLLLKDTQLPVKVEAAIAIKTMATHDETAKQALVPHLKEIVMELLNVIRQTLNEEMTTILKDIVDLYTEETKPLALEMIQHTYSILQSAEEKQDEEEVRMFVGGLLEVVEIIIEMLEDNKEATIIISESVIMIIRLVFEKFHSEEHEEDYYDELISVIYALTSYTIPPDSWQLLPFLYQIFLKDKESFFTEMLPIWHNFITLDTEAFLADPSRLQLTFTMCKDVIESSGDEDMELRALKIMEVILFQCHNQQEQLIPPFLEVVIDRWITREIKTMELKMMCLQVIIVALFLNPRLTFQKMIEIEKTKIAPTMLDKSIVDKFVEVWFEEMELFYGLHDNKVCLFGLCTLLRLPVDIRPESLANKFYPKLLPAIIKRMDEIIKIKQAIAKVSESSWEDAEESDEENDDSISYKEPLSDDQDDVDEQKQKYLQAVSPSNESAILDFTPSTASKDGEESMCTTEEDNTKEGEDEDEDYEEEDDEEETILDSFTCLVDQKDSPLNEYVILKSAVENLQSQDPNFYNHIFSSLSPKEMNQFKDIFQRAEKKLVSDPSHQNNGAQ